jgi:DNA-directed RNA polymerase specialized sigma24 family protein
VSLRDSAAVRHRDEIATAISTLTPAQCARLRKVANLYGYAMTPEDLLQEAFKSALEENGRRCPTDVDVVRFLAESMRSIASGEFEKAKVRPSLVQIANYGDQEEEAEDPPDPAIGVEDWLAREQHAAGVRREILALFDDDPLARDIVEGRMADMTADDLRELTGLDRTSYASKLKLIRRRIDNKYPRGWTP